MAAGKMLTMPGLCSAGGKTTQDKGFALFSTRGKLQKQISPAALFPIAKFFTAE